MDFLVKLGELSGLVERIKKEINDLVLKVEKINEKVEEISKSQLENDISIAGLIKSIEEYKEFVDNSLKEIKEIVEKSKTLFQCKQFFATIQGKILLIIIVIVFIIAITGNTADFIRILEFLKD